MFKIRRCKLVYLGICLGVGFMFYEEGIYVVLFLEKGDCGGGESEILFGFF